MVDYAALARLRPLMSVQVLAEIVGSAWAPPTDNAAGRIFLPGVPEFAAQVDEAGLLGRVSFYRDFPADLVVEGLHTGMALSAVRQLYPSTAASSEKASPGIEGFATALPDGNVLHMRFKDSRLLGFDLLRPGAIYPKPTNGQAWPCHARAYDLVLLPQRADRGAVGNHGWCHGLPPGLRPEQWPLDPRTGQPMRHAFTLKLPSDYRVKGPDLVAISLFGTDWCGEDVPESEAVVAAWDASAPPADPALRPVWLHRTGRHPHEYRMADILGEPYAVLWLTKAEFADDLCYPPLHPRSSDPGQALLPRWTQLGGAAASGVAQAPLGDLAYNLALRWTPRPHDPNAGLAPPAGWSESTLAGYQSIWSRDASGQIELQPWAQEHAPNHIGGTMQPVQAHPEPGFSPFYIEFEEAMGGSNFGGGTAQLDLDQMRLDWACG